jgi:hypothetical protein
MKDNVILSKDEMTAFDKKYGKRYQAIPAPTTFKVKGACACACWECSVKTGGRLCKALPCHPDSVSKPCREDGLQKIWIRKQPEIQK